jgi:hydrogenase-4 component B
LLQWSVHAGSPALRGLAMLTIGLLAFVGALSLATFTKAIGITFLGKPRSLAAEHAHDCKPGMAWGQGILAVLCGITGLAVAPMTLAMEPFSRTLPVSNPMAIASLLLPPQLLLLFATLVAVFLGLSLYMSALQRPEPAIKIYNTWDCGYGPLPARTEETASSFSRPIALIFSCLLQYRVNSQISGRDRRHFPESIEVESFMAPIIENRIYRPSVQFLQATSKLLVNLQTGSLHVHLLYVVVTLLLLVLVGTTIR